MDETSLVASSPFKFPATREARKSGRLARECSACRTGLRLLSSEGIIGFSRAFLAAGARSLLLSLWRIDDAASRDWMIGFYEAYASHGNKAKALREAMERTRERYPDPRFWAGFTLLGLAE